MPFLPACCPSHFAPSPLVLPLPALLCHPQAHLVPVFPYTGAQPVRHAVPQRARVHGAVDKREGAYRYVFTLATCMHWSVKRCLQGRIIAPHGRAAWSL